MYRAMNQMRQPGFAGEKRDVHTLRCASEPVRWRWEYRGFQGPDSLFVCRCRCGARWSSSDYDPALAHGHAHLIVVTDRSMFSHVSQAARQYLLGNRGLDEVRELFADSVAALIPQKPEPAEPTTTKKPYREPVCLNCGKQYLGKGKYCDNACRMQAYRRRLKDKKQRVETADYSV